MKKRLTSKTVTEHLQQSCHPPWRHDEPHRCQERFSGGCSPLCRLPKCALNAVQRANNSLNAESLLLRAVCTSTSLISGSTRMNCPRRPRSENRLVSAENQT